MKTRVLVFIFLVLLVEQGNAYYGGTAEDDDNYAGEIGSPGGKEIRSIISCIIVVMNLTKAIVYRIH